MAFDKNTLSFISPLISTQEILQSLMLNSGFSFWLDAGNMNRCLNWFPQAPERTVMNSYDWNRETRTDSYEQLWLEQGNEKTKHTFEIARTENDFEN